MTNCFKETKLPVLLFVVASLGDVAKNVSECVWNDALQLRHRPISGHGVCLAGASLPIGEYGTWTYTKECAEDG